MNAENTSRPYQSVAGRRTVRPLLLLIALSVVTCAGRGQDITPDQCPTPNSERVTAYKFLAELTYHRVQTGDYETASTAAHNLEFTWGETSGCLLALGVSREEAGKIDHLMDLFIWPLKGTPGKTPDNKPIDAASIAGAYRRYVDELNSVLAQSK